MSIINEILKLVGGAEIVSKEENFDIFKLIATISVKPNIDNVKEMLPEVMVKFDPAYVDVRLVFEISQPVVIHNEENISRKISELENGLELYEEDEPFECNLEIQINKKRKTEIYDFDLFVKHLEDSNICTVLHDFSEALRDSGNIFNVWEDLSPQYTENISFVSKYPSGKTHALCEKEGVRRGLLEKRNKCSHFSHGVAIEVIPEDFHVVQVTKTNLASLFCILEKYLSIIFLSDFSQIQGDELTYRLKGYKLLSGIASKKDISFISNDELYDIYKWTYNEGNLVDKIGLSRNIISIHVEDDSICKIQTGASDSVQSSYDVYLKENVKQYIEIKNKISEFLQSQSDKASEMTKNMFASLKTSLWTFVTFFISVFLIRAFSQNQDAEFFSDNIFYTSLTLILISFIYMSVSILEINSDRNRLLQKYNDIKNRYVDLLNKSDLDKIIDTEKERMKEGGYIDGKKKLYTIAWVCINIALLILILLLKFAESGKNESGHIRSYVTDKAIAQVGINRAPTLKALDLKPEVPVLGN